MRPIRTLTLTTVALAVVLALGACTPAPKKVDIPRASLMPSATPSGGPSVYVPGELLPNGTAPSPGGDGDPGSETSQTGGFEAEGVKDAKGEITVHVGGQTVTVVFDTAIEYPIYNPPDGVVNITWADSSGNVLVIGGTHMSTKPQKTGMDMAVSLTLLEPQVEVFSSGDGRCTVAFTKTEPKYVEGTLKCTGMRGDQGTSIDLSGGFSARF